MARLTTSNAFAIYDDNAMQTTRDSNVSNQDQKEEVPNDGGARYEEDYDSISIIDHALQEPAIPEVQQDPYAEDADDERRESTITSTSISSFPDSYHLTENESAAQCYPAYTPPIIRTRFRRPESVQRMQMTSPPPFGYRSPRQSILSHSKSRTGTPRSARSVNTRGSPRTKRRVLDESEEAEEKQYPLVLLHVSMLPLNAPWSVESLHELLSPRVLENLQLLRSKLSDTVLQRGILIPHPREEYELLEERLLEALDLKDERITKCGHFYGRAARNSETSDTDHGRESDSGIGSSSESADGELCATCEHKIKQSKSAVSSGNKKWIIKVYAANGLMRSSAWAAAWSDMERVDVEILPWISDDIRQKLDERKAQEEAEEEHRHQKHESRIREIVEEHIRLAFEERMVVTVMSQQQHPPPSQQGPLVPGSMRLEPPPSQSQSDQGLLADNKDLPQIYRPSQIPVSILLRNYLYLLARDRKNLFILTVSGLVLLLAIRFSWNTELSTSISSEQDISPDVRYPSPTPQMSDFALWPSSTSLDKTYETSVSILDTANIINSDDAELAFEGESKLEHGGEHLDRDDEGGEDEREAATHLKRSDGCTISETDSREQCEDGRVG